MRTFLAAATALVLLGGTAQADFTFQSSQSDFVKAGEQNIMFEQQFNNQTSFFGDTNQTQTPIEFNIITPAPVQTSPEETGIGTTGKGQADITCTNGCNTFNKGGANGAQLTGLEVKLGTGFGATDFIGNLDFGEGTANIKVVDQNGQTFTYLLSNGQNFFQVLAINNEVITDLQIFEDLPSTDTKTLGQFGWNDFKQPRVSGVCVLNGPTCTEIPVPEPASLALLGAALVGFGAMLHFRKGGAHA